MFAAMTDHTDAPDIVERLRKIAGRTDDQMIRDALALSVEKRDRAEAALGEAREVLTAVLEMDPGDFHWHRFKAHPEKYAYGSYAGMKGDPRSCSCEYDKAVRFLSGAPSFTAPAEPCGARVGTGEVRCDLPLGHEGYHNIVLPHILTFRHPACQRCGGARFVRVELEGVGDLNGYFMTCPTCGGSGTAEGSEERG